MSNELSVQSALPVPASGDNTGPPRSAQVTPAPVAKPAPLFVNPTFQFDPTVGLVVMAFHDSKNAIINSIPSQSQLAAYRSHLATPPGEQAPITPNGKTSTG